MSNDKATLRADTHPDELTNAGVFQIEGVRLASNLIWAVPSKSGNLSEALSLRNEFDADFFVIRPDGIKEIGLGQSAYGHTKTLKPAALAIIEAISSQYLNWHALIKGDNGFVHLQVREGTILPDGGDQFYSDEQSALSSFANSNQKIWDARYSNIEIKDVEYIDTDIDWKSLVKTLPRLRVGLPKERSWYIKTAGISLAAIASLYGASIYLPRIIKTFSSHDELTQTTAPVIQASTLTIPLEQDPDLFLEKCRVAFEEINVRLPGWELKKFTCTATQEGASSQTNAQAGQAKWEWEHATNRTSLKRQVAEKKLFETRERLNRDDFSFQVKENTAQASVKLGGYARKAVQTLPHLIHIRKNVDTHLGPISSGMTISSDPHPRTLLLDLKLKPGFTMPVQNLNDQRLSFSTSYNLEEIKRRSQIAGLEYDLMNWDPSQSSWTVRARIRDQVFKSIEIPGEFL